MVITHRVRRSIKLESTLEVGKISVCGETGKVPTGQGHGMLARALHVCCACCTTYVIRKPDCLLMKSVYRARTRFVYESKVKMYEALRLSRQLC